MPRMIDCHMHTPLCGHAVGELREFVSEASAKGIDLITFSCHMPIDDSAFGGPTIRMYRDALPEYRRLVAEAADYGATIGVRVLCGIEGEVSPVEPYATEIRNFLQAEPFDFVLGSLHHPLAHYQNRLDGLGLIDDDDIVERYFKDLIDAARSGLYDSMSHPDVIKYYGTVSRFRPEAHEAVINDFLAVLAETGVCMEVNTSGLIKESHELHPAPVILDWAARAGVTLTLGSDAHRPEQVGQHFDEVVNLLRTKGFSHLYYFESRQGRKLAI